MDGLASDILGVCAQVLKDDRKLVFNKIPSDNVIEMVNGATSTAIQLQPVRCL